VAKKTEQRMQGVQPTVPQELPDMDIQLPLDAGIARQREARLIRQVSALRDHVEDLEHQIDRLLRLANCSPKPGTSTGPFGRRNYAESLHQHRPG
jgi:hypothetical protein